MKFLDEPALSMLNTILNECEIGDRIITGSIEAFSCKRTNDDKKFAKVLETHYQEELASSPVSSSPIGSLSDAPTRKLLINLISTMNASFPDYDFSTLRPDQFCAEPHFSMIRNAINTQLAEMVEVHHSGFLDQLWRAIELVIQPENCCSIFSYIPDMDQDPFSDSLWSFNYFFYNRKLKKIVYFKCMSKSKIFDDEQSVQEDEEDSSENENDMILDWEDGV